MKDRRRYIMVRKHREHFPCCKAFCAYFSNWLISFHIYSAQTLCCLRAHSHFIYSSLFFVRTPPLTIFCLKLIIFKSCSSRSILSIPHLFSAVFPQSLSFLPFCSCMCVFVCVGLCVIITRPPRGNQQWSLDSPDPLVPQHTCPWGAFPMSSEPLCVHVAAPSVRVLGGIGVGMLDYPLEIYTHTHTHQKKPWGWGIKRWLINISDELQETNSREWKFIPTSLCTGPHWLASD